MANIIIAGCEIDSPSAIHSVALQKEVEQQVQVTVTRRQVTVTS